MAPSTPKSSRSAAQTDRDARIRALLAEQGVEIDEFGTPPAVVELRHSSDPDLGHIRGRDVNPQLSYVRGSSSAPAQLARYVRRGFVPVPSGADVRLVGCEQASTDVYLVADPAVLERAEAHRSAERLARREGQFVDERGVSRRSSTREVRVALSDDGE